jgi:preprotein translocase subunit SecG
MYQLLLLIHVLVAMAVIGLVLIQHGKGADIGASFGSGASNTLFGSAGTGGFLFRLTSSLALIFFLTSLGLSYLIATQYQQAKESLIPKQAVPAETKVPVPVNSPEK